MRSSNSRSTLIIRLLAIAVCLYLTLFGATFNAVLVLLDIQALSLIVFGLMAGGWLLSRWRGGWHWRQSPLDALMLLWIGVFILSIVANPHTWRRSAEALWYMGLYIGVFYLLYDLLAQGIPRDSLVDGLLIAGFVSLIFGYVQAWGIFQEGGLSAFITTRPVSTIGNANAFGSFLAMIAPFALVRAAMTDNRLSRFVMAVYALAAIVLLLLTASRGGWLALGAALVTLLLLLLAEHDLLSIPALRAWWSRQTTLIRGVVTGATLAVLAAAGGVLFLLIQSFSLPGRSTALRTVLWEAALEQFMAHPLTGTGLFTYGHRLSTAWSIPPQQTHSHSHNLPLTMAAETGIPGLLAVILTVALVLRLAWRNRQRLSSPERVPFIGAVAAMMGFGVHHLVDTPAMMPLIALMGVLILVLVITPPDPPPLNLAVLRRLLPVAMLSLWLVLLAAGFWHNTIYRQYYTILSDALETEQYRAAADSLESVIAADPAQPVYHLQQGYLYGLAAAQDQTPETIRAALESYQRYLDLEPYQSSAWSNLAGLYWQSGESARALDAIEQAIILAPDWQHYQWQQAVYAGTAAGDDLTSRTPPESAGNRGANMARFQFLRDVIVMEYLPQTGWHTPSG